MEPERCHFLIVGAGLAGAATAYHLRAQGATEVVVLEREAVPGVHASGRNAAMLRERMDHAALQPLAAESAAALRQGHLAPFRRTGGFLLGTGTTPLAQHVARGRGAGTFHPDDGVIDVAGLLHRYLAGQDIRYGVAYESAQEAQDGLIVETSAGPIQARCLVNAAGPWAGVVGDLPLTPRNRHLFVSAHDESIAADWPFIWDLEHGYYLRPESGGWLLCACDEADAAPGAYAEDPAVIESLGRKLRRWQPDLGDLRIARAWVGQRTFAEDGLPAIGFDADRPRLFHVGGLGGHGVTLSYAVGKLAAAMLLGTSDGMPALAPARLRPASTAPAPS